MSSPGAGVRTLQPPQQQQQASQSPQLQQQLQQQPQQHPEASSTPTPPAARLLLVAAGPVCASDSREPAVLCRFAAFALHLCLSSSLERSFAAVVSCFFSRRVSAGLCQSTPQQGSRPSRSNNRTLLPPVRSPDLAVRTSQFLAGKHAVYTAYTD